MPEFENLTDLYLESDELTDRCLSDVSRLKHLRYLFIDCDAISDSAILEFEEQHPDCRVIPYKRELHGPPELIIFPLEDLEGQNANDL
jgi:hypothetical protein